MKHKTYRQPFDPDKANTGYFIVVNREDIETCAISKCVTWLFDIGLEAKDVWNAKQSLSIKITGYETDQREHWEIEEIRTYFLTLLDQWSEWMFFVNHKDNTLRDLFLCLVDLERIANSNLYRMKRPSHGFTINHLNGMYTLFDEYGFPESECDRIRDSVLSYIFDRVKPMLAANDHPHADAA